MKLLCYDISTKHPPKAFCNRIKTDAGFFSCFETPFYYEKDGKLLKGGAGELLINAPGQIVYHGPLENSEQGFVNSWFYICGIDDLIKRYPLPLCQPFLFDSLFFKESLSRIISEYNNIQEGNEELAKLLLSELIIYIRRSYINSRPNASQILMQQIRKEMLLLPQNNYTVEELADRCGYSKSRFYDLYRSQFGISPIKDLLNMRIEQSKRLLYDGRFSVEEISRLCGFASVYYFSKYFKKREGVPPSRYFKSSTEE